jgi:hypothetical protein
LKDSCCDCLLRAFRFRQGWWSPIGEFWHHWKLWRVHMTDTTIHHCPWYSSKKHGEMK